MYNIQILAFLPLSANNSERKIFGKKIITYWQPTFKIGMNVIQF